MRIFYAFLVIMAVTILFMLPLTGAIYDFRTDIREDIFTILTAPGVFTANVTLSDDLYNSDNSTVSYQSDLATDNPAFASYNGTSRVMGISGLTDNATRLMSVFYDIDALRESAAVNNILDRIPLIWMLVIIAFAPAALFAIFTGKA